MVVNAPDSLATALAAAWSARREAVLERVSRLQALGAQIVEDPRSTALVQEATLEAHRLAGSLGTFGIPVASEHASRAESLLREDTRWTPRRRQELAAALLALGTATRNAGTQQTRRPSALTSAPASIAGTSTADAASTMTPWVLVVEDDALLAELVVDALSQSGIDAVAVGDGVAAVERALHHGVTPPPVVLLDVHLPARDGWSVLQALATAAAATRVVVMSARAGEPEELRAFELGAFDFVSKPLSLPVLVHRVRRALDAAGAGVRVTIPDRERHA